MTTTTWAIAAGIWVLCAIGSYMIAKRNGSDTPGSYGALGFLFGPFGLLIALLGARPPNNAVPAVTGPVPEPAPRQLPQVSVADELAKLIALRDSGELSPAEFYRQRVNLMSAQAPPLVQQPAISSGPPSVLASGAATAAPARREGSGTAERVVIVLIVVAVVAGIYLLFTGGRLIPAKTIDNANLPPAGTIWFGQAYDPTTFALTNQSNTQPATEPVAMVATLSRETTGEYLTVQVLGPAGEIPFGGGQMAAGNNVMAYRLLALQVAGSYPVSVIDSGGNVLASGTLIAR